METPPAPPVKPARKPRGPATESQKAGLALGLGALKAKREQMARDKEAKRQAAAAAPAPVAEVAAAPVAPAAPVPAAPAPQYVTLDILERFKTDILSSLKPAPAAVAPVAAPPAPAPVAASPALSAPVEIAQPLRGTALLDQYFFRGTKYS